MRKSFATTLLLTFGLLFSQCSHSTDSATPTETPLRTPAQLTATEKSLVESINRFSFKLFRAIDAKADPNKNLFVSPLSVSYALGILRNGADGATREGIDSVLEIAGFSIEEANVAYQGLTTILENADSSVRFDIANSFWSRKGKEIQRDFKRVCQTYYGAKIAEVDFQDAATAEAINNWVNQNTGGKITKIVEPPMSSSVAAMLLNALYFKAAWTFPFDIENTEQRPFYLEDGSQVTCEMMYKDADEDWQKYPGAFKRQPNTYFHDSLTQGVHLPYGNSDFRMTVLLPDSKISLREFVANLSQARWNSWDELPTEWDMWLNLPKFAFEYRCDLKEVLTYLGMSSAFDPASADFNNAFVDGVGWIDQFTHGTFVQVNEKGTEAAAITNVMYADALPPEFTANRPFLFVVQEVRSGSVLFIGKVVNPTLTE